MRAPSRPRPARGAPAGLVALVALLLVAGARADEPSSLSSGVEQLRSESSSLAGERRGVLLELYALQARLGSAERRVEVLRARGERVERERDSARRRLEIARAARDSAQGQLAARLRAIYVEGEIDPLALLLGAESIDDALSALDSLTRLARQDREIVMQVTATRRSLRAAVRSLGRRAAEVRVLTAEAEAARDSLATAEAERRSYLAELARRERLNAAAIARLSVRAAEVEAQAQEVAAATPASAAPEPLPAFTTPPGDGQTLTVSSTGYALPGTTATGLPVGWGVVAVDPAVIPLGTRMTIPGYGEGVAADTGSAVRGAIIDLWFPTTGQALEWGRRTVTITLH